MEKGTENIRDVTARLESILNSVQKGESISVTEYMKDLYRLEAQGYRDEKEIYFQRLMNSWGVDSGEEVNAGSS